MTDAFRLRLESADMCGRLGSGLQPRRVLRGDARSVGQVADAFALSRVRAECELAAAAGEDISDVVGQQSVRAASRSPTNRPQAT